MIYAVIDTNVLVSALITKKPEAATAKVVRLLLEHSFIPMYDADIIAEYEDVLHRTKFPISSKVADALIDYIVENLLSGVIQKEVTKYESLKKDFE